VSAAPVPVAAAIAVLVQDRHVLLVRRANPPDQGLWGFPGGRIEPGETVFAAAERELAEETGLTGRAVRLLDALDLLDRAPEGTLRHHFILLAVACTPLSGTLRPADDALDAAWFDADALQDDDPCFSRNVANLARMGCARTGQGAALDPLGPRAPDPVS
jgi:ADP-ribose pyrophosphatase YjhB (NUDIX family)